jgi:hypothetical protein
VSPNQGLGQTQFRAQFAYFIFEKVAEGFHEFKSQFGRQSADIVMRLDGGGRTVFGPPTFDDIGVERALCEEASTLDSLSLLFENVDEGVPDNRSFSLRIAYTPESGEKSFLSIDGVQFDTEGALEG